MMRRSTLLMLAAASLLAVVGAFFLIRRFYLVPNQIEAYRQATVGGFSKTSEAVATTNQTFEASFSSDRVRVAVSRVDLESTIARATDFSRAARRLQGILQQSREVPDPSVDSLRSLQRDLQEFYELCGPLAESYAEVAYYLDNILPSLMRVAEISAQLAAMEAQAQNPRSNDLLQRIDRRLEFFELGASDVKRRLRSLEEVEVPERLHNHHQMTVFILWSYARYLDTNAEIYRQFQAAVYSRQAAFFDPRESLQEATERLQGAAEKFDVTPVKRERSQIVQRIREQLEQVQEAQRRLEGIYSAL